MPFPLKTLLIDDERPVRLYTKSVLQNHQKYFDLIGEAADGEEGLQMVEALKPDLIFLDIQMPGLTGFEMLARLQHPCQVVFLTAYDQYALKAFEENGVDYLLKPIEESRLQKTIEKLSRLQTAAAAPLPNLDALRTLLAQVQPTAKLSSLSIKTGNKILLVNLDDVVYLEAKEKYVQAVTTDERNHLTNLSLQELEERLPNHFLRIHKGVIVNRNYILELQRHFNNRFVFVMKNKARTELQSGTSYVHQIREALDL
jgi:two-component system LytT family response regulator